MICALDGYCLPLHGIPTYSIPRDSTCFFSSAVSPASSRKLTIIPIPISRSLVKPAAVGCAPRESDSVTWEKFPIPSGSWLALAHELFTQPNRQVEMIQAKAMLVNRIRDILTPLRTE